MPSYEFDFKGGKMTALGVNADSEEMQIIHDKVSDLLRLVAYTPKEDEKVEMTKTAEGVKIEVSGFPKEESIMLKSLLLKVLGS